MNFLTLEVNTKGSIIKIPYEYKDFINTDAKLILIKKDEGDTIDLNDISEELLMKFLEQYNSKEEQSDNDDIPNDSVEDEDDDTNNENRDGDAEL